MSTTVTGTLSDRVLKMEESATLRMAQLGREVKAQGHDVISLSLGEPDFDTPEHIKDAAKRALDAGATKYTPVPGTAELRKAISDKFKRENGLTYAPEQIVVSTGAKQSIANVAMALLNPGDEAIILAPFWVSYSAIVDVAEGVPVIVGAGIEDDYKVSADQIEAAITDRTKFILFSSPCNPTGSVYTAEELGAIARMLEKYPDIYVVSDEIYEHINFTGAHASIGTFPEVADRTITVNGFSKGFAMTGWRLGYIGAPLHVAKACSKLQGQSTSGANSIAQAAGAHALNSSLEPSMKMKEAFARRRELMINGLEKIEGLRVNRPQGAFYIFPDVSAFFGKSAGEYTINNSDDLAEYLLLEAHVATVTGGAFGAPTCLRISYAASEEQLTKAIERIADALGKLG
ncbi:pyridoxal phosphate-dependent aminotransferase [Lewinella sp. W8]|uniref:pyridoxal phosphate-dependent aminotransferase n=1 Tax=Lewinella sp. W8 TaxID=2528208 RepID=UPI0010681483|nr:pyridoxal phosphate-dependent aminotransferase [Lewinella sp. W8]MTB50894.1 aminotransferase class I/II-fold pyridoxal phosphate-dependent enzyme [Lewinella sp. W8]